MKTSFLVGIGLAAAYETIAHLRSFFRAYRRKRSATLWVIYNGTPTLATYAFLASAIIEWSASSRNYSAAVFFAVVVWAVNIFLANVIDGNVLWLNDVWIRTDKKRHAFACAVTYVVSLLGSLILYVDFPDVVGEDWNRGISVLGLWVFPLAALVTFPLCYYLFQRLQAIEEADAEDVVRDLLHAFCCRHILDIDLAGFNGRLLRTSDIDELNSIRRLIEDYLRSCSGFRVVVNGELIPGLRETRLSRPRIEKIAIRAQKDFERRLKVTLHLVKISVGSDAELAEAEDWIRNNPGLLGAGNSNALAECRAKRAKLMSKA